MKRVLVSLIALALAFGMVGLADAALISFMQPLTGIDDTTGWATVPSTNPEHLGHSYSLLGGDATVSAWVDGISSDVSHRLLRGIGVWGNENDEVDRRGEINAAYERVLIEFNVPYCITGIELRSLFVEGNIEWGAVDMSLTGGGTFTDLFQAGGGGSEGDVAHTYATAYSVDELLFYIPQPNPFGDPGMYDYQKSEFAVAAIDGYKCEPVPEPSTLLLLGSGLVGLAGYGFRRRRK